jgi:autotransporter-associated beta strand protein
VISRAAGAQLTTGTLTVDGSAGSADAVISSSSTSSASPAIVAQNITHNAVGANTFDLRGSGGYGKVTANISYGTGTVTLLDNTSWELSGANTYGLLNIAHASATLYCGAVNTLSASGVVQDSGVGGTLNLNNLAGTAACSQTIAGLSQTVKVTSSVGTPVLTLNGAVDCSQTNVISGTLSLVKAGPFTQTLCGANTYTGNTTVSAGTLSLTTPSIYTNSTVSVASGAVLNLNYTATNRVAALVLNGSSQPPGLYGSSTPGGYITGGGYLLVPSPGPSGPGYITGSFTGNTLTMSWPAGQGWRLAIQTNHLAAGISSNPNDWMTVPGSDGINQTNITIDPARPAEFYRLVYP